MIPTSLKTLFAGLALSGALCLAAQPAAAADAPAASARAAAASAAPGTFRITPADDAWRAALPRDADRATQAYLDRLPADVVARSNAYFEGGYWLILWNWLMGLAVAAVLLSGRRSARLRDWAHRTGRGRFRGDALYAGAWSLFAAVLSAPLDIWVGFFREHAYGMATQTFGPWFVEYLMKVGIAAVITMLVVPLVYAGIRRAGERWWLFATGFTVVLMMVGLVVMPIFVDPLFNTYQPVTDPVVRESVLAMAHADGVAADEVMEFDASRQTTRVSANVTGLFGSAAVRLNDNLLRRSSLPEIRAVMGHELGHFVMNHIPKALCEFALLFMAGFAIVNAVTRRLIAGGRNRWGIQSMGDIAGLPLLAAVFFTFMFLATPVLNTLVRQQEIEADRFGLNLARDPLGMAEVTLKLTEYRKPDPGPIEEFVFFDHPSTRFRIHDAMRWRAAMKTDGPGRDWPQP